MIKNVQLLHDYIGLNYRKGDRPSRIHDSVVEGIILARLSLQGCTIHYLYNGSSLLIPWEWIDLFGGLYVHSGDIILGREPEGSDYLETMILLLTKLQIWIGQRLSNVDGDKLLDTLADIGSLGTGKLRKFLSETYSLEFQPFKFTSLEKTLDI